MARQGFQCTGTFDVECANWNVFAVAAIFDGHRPRIFYSPDDMLDAMLEIGGVWWSHAGGVYDILLILELARKRGIACQVDRSQHRVTRVVMGSLTLRDSYSLWPVPLDDICGAVGQPVPRLPWKCRCRKSRGGTRPGCGGYCRIGPKAREGDPELERYVIDDCRSLYAGINALHEFALENGIELRGTLGQTAWMTAQREIGVPDSDMSWHIWRHARRGDRGGRTAIIRPRAYGPGAHHDICNAYPAQLMRCKLPLGECREVGARHAQRALAYERPGMYTCTVNVPSSLFLPPLPWLHAGQLSFPTGRFTGTWTLPELTAALERGVSIESVHTGLVWEMEGAVFSDLVARWYEIRRKVGRKTPFGQWVGRLAKAFTGKLSERPNRSRVTMNPTEIKVCLRQKACKRGCTGRCGAYEQLDLDGMIWAIPFQHLGPSTYPQWSAYLRAQTRVQWLEQAERYGDDLAFGNTDSLWTIGRMAPSPLGDGLGEWEYQHAWQDLEIRSPTCYAYTDPATGVRHFVGIPGVTEREWRRGEGVLDRGLVTFGQAVRSAGGERDGTLFKRRRRNWSLPGGKNAARTIYGDRRLADNGITYPLDADELRQIFAERLKRKGEATSNKRKIDERERLEEEDPLEPTVAKEAA